LVGEFGEAARGAAEGEAANDRVAVVNGGAGGDVVKGEGGEGVVDVGFGQGEIEVEFVFDDSGEGGDGEGEEGADVGGGGVGWPSVGGGGKAWMGRGWVAREARSEADTARGASILKSSWTRTLRKRRNVTCKD
jgi:hypothetical protein